MVFDEVERELLRERELIKIVNTRLEDLVEKVKVQIRKLREFVFSLAEDLHCKENTLKIEEYNEKLNEKSIELSILNDKSIIKPAYVLYSFYYYYRLLRGTLQSVITITI